MKKGFWMGAVTALAVVALMSSDVLKIPQAWSTAAPAAPVSVPPNAPGTSELKKSSESFRLIAKRVGPAVVSIKATKGGKKADKKIIRRRGFGFGRPERGPRQQMPNGEDPFQDFFERFGEPFFQPFPETGPQTSLGSGIIVDKKGIIVTNNHVVEGANEVLVTLYDQKTDVKAKMIGTDPRSDLAVLKLEKEGNYPFVEWADSDLVEVGDWAIAIGSPFALGHSVTVGIVSAKGRNGAQLGIESNPSDLIQTDAAINPGNSGGPLCDLEGKVMGVNTAIYTRSGGYMGIGFAISSNAAKDVVSTLIKDGKKIYGWLGVFIQGVDPELAKELGIKEGVMIHEVVEKSPAADAGLNPGDVVLDVDGKAIKDTTQLQRIISAFKPGQKIKLKVLSYSDKDKKPRTVTVTIAALPTEEQGGGTRGESGEQTEEEDRLGLVVSAEGKTVQIEAVQTGSIAQQSDLKAGDIILKINAKPVDSLATYKKLIKNGSQFYLEIKRGGRTMLRHLVLPE